MVFVLFRHCAYNPGRVGNEFSLIRSSSDLTAARDTAFGSVVERGSEVEDLDERAGIIYLRR